MKKTPPPQLNFSDALRDVGTVDVRAQVRSFIRDTHVVVEQHSYELAARTRYAGSEFFCKGYPARRSKG